MWDNQLRMVILFPLISLAAGLGVAFSAREQIRRGALRWREPYLPGLLLFQLLVLFPVGIYLLSTYPAWSMLYLSEAEEVSSGHGFWIVVGSLLAAAAGYQLGHFLCGRRLDRFLIGAVALSCVGILLFFVLAAGRLGHLAEDGNWQNAPGILDSELGTFFAFVIPVLLGGLIFLFLLFSMEGRKVRRAQADSAMGADAQGSKPTAAYPPGHQSHEHKMSPVFGSMDISSPKKEFPDTTPSLSQSSPSGSTTKKPQKNIFSKK